jgi:hypothetical protein
MSSMQKAGCLKVRSARAVSVDPESLTGRPLHAFGFGTPCCASPDLARYCAPFCTTVVHENDFVCTLSLGVLHDLKDLALSLQDNPDLMKDIMSSITGLRRPFSTGEDPLAADEQTAEWLWSLRQAMKALSVNDKLCVAFPVVYIFRFRGKRASCPGSTALLMTV